MKVNVGAAGRQVLVWEDSAANAVRRARFIAQVQRRVWQVGAKVELDLVPDVVFGRHLRVLVDPGVRTVLRLGEGSSIEDGVTFMLKGGALLGGPRVEIRRDCVLNLTGTLRIDGDTPLSWGTVIHCSNDIHLEAKVGIAEQVTIADSSHYFTTPDEHFWHNTKVGSVHVGANTWLCPKVTLVSGADVGAHCIVAAGSVVTGKVPDGHLASGVPAKARPLDLPWTRE